MKISTIMVVAALAFAVTGCKYDKAAKGGAAGEGDDTAKVTDINIDELKIDELTADEGEDIDKLAGEKRFEDLYVKCTDVDFEPVYFSFDSSMIPAGELGKAEAVARHLTEKNERVVVVEGNCDERGSNEYNLTLGEGRSTILRNFLIQNGIAADRIQTRSYGEEKPAADGHDESAWAKNRRGEFVIFDANQKK